MNMHLERYLNIHAEKEEQSLSLLLFLLLHIYLHDLIV